MHSCTTCRGKLLSFAILILFTIVSIPVFSQLSMGDDPGLGVIGLKTDPDAQIVSPDLLLIYETWRAQPNEFENPVPLAVIDEAGINIEAVSKTEDASQLVAELVNIGLESPVSFQRIVNGWLPISAIRAMAGLEHLQFVHLAYQPFLRTGSVTSQGDTAQRSNLARTSFSVDGTGVTVGVLSDSYNDLAGEAADITSGDLPTGGINNLDNGPGGGSDEGRAMLQIIHDVAPGASLAFHTASGGLAVFASGITDLQTAGCDVIVDDIGYANDAFFQDGVVAQAADAVTALGAAYFSAAGNDARQSYEGTFLNGGTVTVPPTSYTAHDFDTGAGTDILQSITIPNNGSITLALNWEDPFFSISGAPGAASDMDLFLVNAAGTTVLASSVANNIGGDAFEIVGFTNTSGAAANYNILIVHKSGPFPNQLKWILLGEVQSVNEFDSQSASCFAHPNAAGAMAVGAAFWGFTPQFGTTPPLLETFSSGGGTPILYNTSGTSVPPVIRNKPDFTAPDGGDNTFFGSDIGFDVGTFPNFFGTSAAAPHAAGVAALMLDFQPGLTPTQIRALLQSTAVDILPTGFDFDSGSGLIDANNAIAGISSLPVELNHFLVRTVADEIHLAWQTASEYNNLGFEIEMAVQAVANQTPDWQYVDFVEGKGNQSTPSDYQYQWQTPLAGTYFFQLKQLDFDGHYHYSEIKTVSLGSSGLLSQSRYDPAKETIVLTLGGKAGQVVNLDLFDITGKQLESRSLIIPVNGTFSLPVPHLPSGVYLINLSSDTEIATQRILVH